MQGGVDHRLGPQKGGRAHATTSTSTHLELVPLDELVEALDRDPEEADDLLLLDGEEAGESLSFAILVTAFPWCSAPPAKGLCVCSPCSLFKDVFVSGCLLVTTLHPAAALCHAGFPGITLCRRELPRVRAAGG